MWIKRLRTKGFGCLGDRDFEFINGLNLIYGPNEAGKTTLFEAIEEALLERPRFARDYRGSAEALLVTEKGEFWTGTRGKKLLRMDKRFFENVFFVRTGELGFKDPKDFLRDLKTRFLDVERLYAALDFIGERLGRDLSHKRKPGTLISELEQMKKELAELERKKLLFEERAQGLIQLKAFSQKKEQLERELETLERRVSLFRKAKEKHYLRERYKSLLAERDHRKELEALMARREELSAFTPQRIEEIRALERETERKRDLIRAISIELHRLEKSLTEKEEERLRVIEGRRNLSLQEEKARIRYEALKGLKDLVEAKRNLEEKKNKIQERLHALQEEMLKIQKEMRGLEEVHRENLVCLHRLKVKGWTFLILAGFGLFLTLLGLKGTLWLSVLGGGEFTLALAFILRTKRELAQKEALLKESLHEKETLQKHWASLEVEKDRLLGELLAFEGEEKRIFASMGTDPVGLEARLKELLELEAQLKELNLGLKALEEKEDGIRQELIKLKEELERKKEELHTLMEDTATKEHEILQALKAVGVLSVQEAAKKALELREVEGKIKLLESKAVRPLHEIESELWEIELRLKELEDVPLSSVEVDVEEELKAKREALRECLEQMKVLEGELREKGKIINMDEEKLFSEMERLKEEIASKERERDMLFELFRVMRLLEEEVQKELVKVLEGKTLEWFKGVIGERASRITISDDDILVTLDGRLLSSRQLSSGTRDPLYLCARIAIAESMKGPRTLFLDDPFLTCDSERSLKLFRLVRELSQRFQILMATKESWLVEVAAKEGVNLIEL